MSEREAGPNRRSADCEESVEDALQRALAHARGAVAEGLAAARAPLDAATIALHDQPAPIAGDTRADAPPLGLAFDSAARGLDELIALAGAGVGTGGVPDALLSTILDSLDDEIERWEARSQGDAEARAVLRAFLGVREILWEVGVRRRGEPTGGGSERRDPKRTGTRRQASTTGSRDDRQQASQSRARSAQ